jgi:LPS sulfotransferase NodH
MNFQPPQARTMDRDEAYEFLTHASQGSVDLAHPAQAMPHVTIACTMRSGSNLLCEMLRVHGFGTPKEWFQIGSPHLSGAENLQLLKLQMGQFLHEHESARWQGVKWDWPQFQRLRKLAPFLPEAASLLNALQTGKWFLLLRRDLAAQAVSFYAAQNTNAWMGEHTPNHQRLEKDFDGIYERFAELSADIFAWETHISAGSIRPMRLFYEDLVSGDPDIWLGVMRHLDPAFEAARLDVAPLRDRPQGQNRIRKLKRWFSHQIMAGRRPRSAQSILQEIGRTVARVESQIPLDGILGKLTADLLGSPNAFRVQKLDLRRELCLSGAATLVHGSEFTDRVSLKMDAPADCRFQVNGATRILLQLHAHSWSGIAEITLGDRREEIDLFNTRTDTRHVFYDFPEGFTGTIAIRCTGLKNLLSKGAEVWLHRVMVLSAG